MVELVVLLLVVAAEDAGLDAVVGELLVCALALAIEIIAVIPKQTPTNDDGRSFIGAHFVWNNEWASRTTALRRAHSLSRGDFFRF